MSLRPRGRRFARAVILLTLAVCFAIAAWRYGGVNATDWQYLAIPMSLASLGAFFVRSRRSVDETPLELWLLCGLLAWMGLQLLPLPLAVVELLSPWRTASLLAARSVTGGDIGRWLPLSVAPGGTAERLLFVLPAMAVFVAAREMPGWWPGRRAWVVVAPLVAVATFEALSGLAQFAAADASAAGQSVSGTYVNRNHFAGLLELAFPLVMAWALSAWFEHDRSTHHRFRHHSPSLGRALATGGLIAAAGGMLGAVIVSLSRMGFLATLVAGVTVAVGGLLLQRRHARVPLWMWAMPAVFIILITAFFTTGALLDRFGSRPGADEISTDGRVQIWSESWNLFRAYPVTGSGLGTFERALYPFRRSMPTAAVDYAHNDYLQLLSELGIVGFALAMALGVRVFERSVAAFRSQRLPWLGLGVMAALLASAVHSLVDFNLYIPANAFATAWIAGVASSPDLHDGRA